MGKHIANIMVMLAVLVIAVVNMNDPGTVTDTEKNAITGAIEQIGDAAFSIAGNETAPAVVPDSDAVVTVTGTKEPADHTGSSAEGYGPQAGAIAVIIGALMSLFYSIVAIVKRRKAKGGAATLLLMALPLLILLCFTACGTLGSVGAGISLGNGLCFQVVVTWDDKTTTTETVKAGDVEYQLQTISNERGKKIVEKPTIVSVACDKDGEDTAIGYYTPRH